MHRLRFLKIYSSRYEEDINKVHIFQGLETNFTELRYLHWYGYPIKSLSNINLQNLITLEMPYSNVEQLWSGIQYLCRLKEIDLSCSRDLTSLPDSSGFPNLKSLILVGCTSLHEIYSSIQTLHKLDFLDLTDCKSLEYLPNCVNLESLRKLYLSGCSSLKILPEIASNIEELYLDETAIEELPSSIEYLCRLVLLDVKSCSRLKSLPNNICNWKSLKRLNLSDCSELASLPDEIGSLESLMELEAEGTAIREVPASIKCLNNLNMLSFRSYYTDQETVSLLLPPLLDLHHLRELDLTNCGIMKIPDSLSNLSSLKRLYLFKNNFESIPTAIINLSNLSELNICNCERLQNLPVLPLISIDAHSCTSLEALLYLSIVGTPVSKDQPFIFVNFANSVKLDWNVRKDILEDALLQMQHLATLWKQEYYDKEWDMIPRACICYPGSEVPDWFQYRNMRPFINVELPRNLFSRNFVSFALCVVFAFREHQDYDWDLVTHFECKCQCVPDSTLASNTSTCGLPCYINSDHVFMGFDFHLYPSIHIGESCQNNEVSFHFYLKRLYDGNEIECCKITECGVRLMYAQELGKSNGSVSSCEEIDELCSKRCKYLRLLSREK
ncbi:hypothetical protein Ddye_028259 [Dipteronia dyeriana]|uniref:C-JID domain-containing protein n=1 Tax=Dipteronia dyeriana TaxID=168575 RepID=A0AAD9TQM5_9ROSI|nr:hypothetical protein Ddye_028259 [Dipteronia dyeriana]